MSMSPIYDMVLGAAQGTLGKVFDRLAALIPAGEKEKQDMLLELRAQALDAARVDLALKLQEDQQFRDFMLAYEGKANEVPRGVVTLRSTVRPVLSYLLIISTAWLVWNHRPIPQELYWLDMLCLSFWFGERALKSILPGLTGLTGAFKGLPAAGKEGGGE